MAKPWHRSPWLIAPSLVLLALLAVPVGSFVYEAGGGEACARCHEIRPSQQTLTNASHRKLGCSACHGDALTFDLAFHLTNFRRVVTHWRDRVPVQIRIKHRDIPALLKRCQKCHQQEFADWQAGPHSATYRRIFLNTEHNRKRRLTDDCFRCHGMHYEGAIRDLVTPIDATGPWTLRDARMADEPAIPCMSCHEMHREGNPLSAYEPSVRKPRTGEEIIRPSLALFDRRTKVHLAVSSLPLPAMQEGNRPVTTSPDPRQALCYQCHAPLAFHQVGSGDDRTGIGVHEGISCLACHQKHRQTTRASCSTCHPRLSNCGLDVEKMDTTFRDPASKHNIHFVKCADCHPKGIPPKKARFAETSPRPAASRGPASAPRAD